MKARARYKLAAVIATVLTIGCVGVAQPASAAACGDRYEYKATQTEVAKFVRATGKDSSVTGGPGVTLSISRSTTFGVSGSITSSASVSVGAAIATVQAGMSVTIGADYSSASSSSGTWTVPKSYKVGRLEIGANKYKGYVKKYLELKNCSLQLVGNPAYFNAPSKEWHFRTSKVS